MPLYEYKCSEGHVTEHITKLADRLLPVVCECGNLAHYTISAPNVRLEGITGAFPGAYDKWEKMRREKLQQERKLKQNHG